MIKTAGFILYQQFALFFDLELIIFYSLKPGCINTTAIKFLRTISDCI